MGCCGRSSKTTRPDGDKKSWCILCKIWEILTREKTPEGDPCVVIPGHLIRKPDPCIYDQFLLMQLGQPVTWDNPDVRIFLGGVEQYTYNLTVSTEYDVAVTVHNASRDEAANQTAVDIHWIEFGAGGQVKHPITVTAANVPIWPGTAVVGTKWKTPDTPGHYCIEVELSHPDDGNPSNNRGWNNTQVYAAQSPVDRDIRIFNRHPGECPRVEEGGGPLLRPHRVFLGWAPLFALATLLFHHTLLMDMPTGQRFLALLAIGYVVGAIVGLASESVFAWIKRGSNAARAANPRTDRTDCHLVDIKVDSYEFEDKIGKDFDPPTVFKGAPALWNATVTPPSFVFLPGEAYRDVVLHVDAPDTAGPPANFNVNVWQGGVPTGGVTVTVTTGG